MNWKWEIMNVQIDEEEWINSPNTCEDNTMSSSRGCNNGGLQDARKPV